MKAEDITRENTRKEMNNIALKIGIENPESFSTKSELADEMVKHIEVHGLDDELDSKVEEVKDLLKDVRETNLNLNEFKKGFKKMRTARNECNLPKALDLAEHLIEQGKELIEAKEVVDQIRDLLSDFNEGEVKTAYKEDLKKLLVSFEEGEYAHRIIELKELLDDIQDHYDLKNKLDNKFPSARQRLSHLRKIDLDIGSLKRLVNSAVQARKKGEFQKGIYHIEKFLEQSELLIEINSKIDECKSNIRQLKDLDLDIDHYIRVLQTAKQKADSGEYQYSLELLKDINDEMGHDIEKADEPLDEEELEEFEETDVEEEPVESADVEETLEPEIDTKKEIYSEENLNQINQKLDDLEEHLLDIKELIEKLVEK